MTTVAVNTRGDDQTPGSSLEASHISQLEAQLGALYEVSSVLSRSLNLRETLSEVLTVLHERNRLHYGMVSLMEAETGELLVRALHKAEPTPKGAALL
jgi:Nif-specific regulatory protein